MKKALQRKSSATYYYKDDKRVEGVPKGIRGNLTNIRGDLSDITGDLSGITGDLSGITGDLSGITGDLLGISGDLDDCEITAEERAAVISVEDLIKDNSYATEH